MPRVDVVRSSPVQRTARVMQLESVFDVPPHERSEVRWSIDLPIHERPWKVGMIVGPSGAGKSTIARELFPTELARTLEWPHDRALVDGFAPGLPIKEITGWLSSVGFSSPPSWLRPFHVLSTGEQFRATVARLLSESEDLVVVDEFTSVVDRQVAKAASSAIASAVRRSDRRFVAVGCHYDVIDWLQPDWICEPHEGRFSWREVQPRPTIELEVVPVYPEAWQLFKQHHYLSGDLNKASRAFVALWAGVPAAFVAVLPMPGRISWWREHRLVCLPDYQGLGIGGALSDWAARMFSVDKPVIAVSGHPGLAGHWARSKYWKLIGTNKQAQQADLRGERRRTGGETRASVDRRITKSATWVGPSATREEFETMRKSFREETRKGKR